MNSLDYTNDGTISIGAYIFPDTAFLTSIDLKIIYVNPNNPGQLLSLTKTFNSFENQKWNYLSDVITLPTTVHNSMARVRIDFVFASGGSSASDYSVYVNGITIGQKAEQTSAISLGTQAINIPSSIALPQGSGVEAFSYGSGIDNGYYLIKNNSLMARNSGVPLVYGAYNTTKVYPNSEGMPSLIVPGKGFLNNIGRYQDFTVEFWTKISCESNTAKRIFGPISSLDGLYVENGYMTLRIGDDYKTHFISDWSRPMLINIRIIKNKATVLLNSEEVISIDIDVSKLTLPDKFDVNGKDQDWLGFYAYSDISPIEIDCVAIYPYSVSQALAKRKMVYAQAVSSVDSINSSYNGESVAIDYPFADYTANYSYPDFASWEQGTYNNLKVTKNSITTPDYKIPQIFLQDKSLEQLYEDNTNSTQLRYTYTNFIENPSFSQWPDPGYWIGMAGSSWSRFSSGGVNNGPYAQIVANGNAFWTGIYTVPDNNGYFPMEANKTIMVQGTFKAVSFPMSFRAYVGIFTISGQLIGNFFAETPVLSPSDGWKDFSFSFTSFTFPVKVGYVTFGPVFPSMGQTWQLGRAMLYQQTSNFTGEGIPYFDGSANNFNPRHEAVCSWTGAQHDSPSIATINSDRLYSSGYESLSFRPNSSWDNKHCYINYNQYGFLSDPINAIYVVFTADDLTTEQTLLKVYNTVDGSYFTCYIKDGRAYLGFDIENFTWTAVYDYKIHLHQPNMVGLKIDNMMSTSFYNEFSTISSLRSFFSNPSLLKMYVGGDNDPTHTFKGKIYGFFIDSIYHTYDLNDSVNSETNPNGLARDAYFSWQGFPLWNGLGNRIADLIDRGASYGLRPYIINDQYKLDIATYGEWKDYVPLTYFAQYTLDKEGNKVYDLDFIQFNANLPDSSNFDLIKMYVTFQFISEGTSKNLRDFAIEVDVTNSKILDLNEYPNWRTTKFRVLDNTIIYPREDVDFEEIGMTYTAVFDIPASLTKDVELRRIEFASQAFDNNSFNKVGTRFGNEIYPYTKTGFYYNHKAKNPFSIYKGTTPYLYLTKNSGIKMYRDFIERDDIGLSIPMNTSKGSDYKVGAVQSWMYYDKNSFPTNQEFVLFKILYKGGTKLVCARTVNASANTAKVYIRDEETNSINQGVAFYLNGNITTNPTISAKEWNVLGIAFLPSLNLDSHTGYINITSPLLFNNVSFYKSTYLQEIQGTKFRLWQEVKEEGGNTYDWSYWFNNFIWNDVLIIGDQGSFSIDPSSIYKTYTGTNKIIIDDNEGIGIDIDSMAIRKETSWLNFVGTAL
jgi:hypothetical protein